MRKIIRDHLDRVRSRNDPEPPKPIDATVRDHLARVRSRNDPEPPKSTSTGMSVREYLYSIQTRNDPEPPRLTDIIGIIRKPAEVLMFDGFKSKVQRITYKERLIPNVIVPLLSTVPRANPVQISKFIREMDGFRISAKYIEEQLFRNNRSIFKIDGEKYILIVSKLGNAYLVPVRD